MALVRHRPDQLVERERPSLTARAAGQAGSVDERRMGHRANRSYSPSRSSGPAVKDGRGAHRCSLTNASRSRSRGQRSRISARAVVAVSWSSTTTRWRRRTATRTETFEQPRMGRLRILAPDDDGARTVPDLPQRGGGDAAQRSRRRAGPRPIEAQWRPARPGGRRGQAPPGHPPRSRRRTPGLRAARARSSSPARISAVSISAG